MTSARVELATELRRKAIAAMLSRAFFDDPAICWIFPDPALRARRLPGLFKMLFDADASRGMRLVTERGEAATLWRAPRQAETGAMEYLASAIPMIACFGTAIGRGLAVVKAIDANMPGGDFWYLHVAGCDPIHQGKGLGGAAVRAGIERVADGRYPVYLETPLEKNIGFYRSMGFDVSDEWSVPGGGPRFWSMWRPA